MMKKLPRSAVKTTSQDYRCVARGCVRAYRTPSLLIGDASA